MDVSGKRYLVVGFGLSGQAAAYLLASKGARVLAIDESKEAHMKRRARRKKNLPIETQFGMKTVPKGRYDTAILSPGIHPGRGLGKSVYSLDIPVIGELELGFQFSQCPVIAITGTNGKTTTTELVETVLRSCRKRTLACGNIGMPLSDAALKSDRLDYLTVEVSSFQLETIELFRPAVSVLMNITPDHLDRYDDMAMYARTKAALWKNSCGGDVAVVNVETERYLATLGIHCPVQPIRYSIHGEKVDLYFDGQFIQGSLLAQAGLSPLKLDQTRLRGVHNAENIMCALAVAWTLKLNLKTAWKAICGYKPLDHRLETVAKIRGVEYINDSKATNLDAMIKALGAFGRPVVLIAGGKDKGFDFDAAQSTIRAHVRSCILIGETRDKIFKSWNRHTPCRFADTLEEAVHLASGCAMEGDVVLLSPACSSFDMFSDYEERGEVFRSAVQQLK